MIRNICKLCTYIRHDIWCLPFAWTPPVTTVSRRIVPSGGRQWTYRNTHQNHQDSKQHTDHTLDAWCFSDFFHLFPALCHSGFSPFHISATQFFRFCIPKKPTFFRHTRGVNLGMDIQLYYSILFLEIQPLYDFFYRSFHFFVFFKQMPLPVFLTFINFFIILFSFIFPYFLIIFNLFDLLS